MKFNFLHFVKILVLEIVYYYFIGYGYAIFSMLAFGEGANSFMYSKTNDIIYICLLFMPQSIFNIVMLKKYWTTNKPKKLNYFIVGIIIIALVVNFSLNEHYM